MTLQHLAEEKFLYLSTIGRSSGLAREIEIWFIVCRERFYLFAEKGEAAGWVKNIRRNSMVTARVGDQQFEASARVLHRQADLELWKEVAALAERKYGWGDGLPIEIAPVS